MAFINLQRMHKGYSSRFFVCASLCVSVPELHATVFISTSNSLIVHKQHLKDFHLVNFAKNAWLQSHGVICLPRQSVSLLVIFGYVNK